MCADVLKDYTVVVYFSNPDVAVAAELMSQRTGLRVEMFASGSYEDSLRLHARARVFRGSPRSTRITLRSRLPALDADGRSGP